MKNKFELKLSVKILASLFAAMALSLAFTAYKVDLIFQASSLKSEKAKGKLLLDSAAFDMSVSLYLGLNSEAVNRMRELLRNDEVLSVALILPDGKSIAKVSSEKASKESLAEAIKIEKNVTDTINGKVLATIEMEYSNDNYSLLIENFRMAMNKVALVSALVLALSLLIVRRLLRPLDIIAEKMRLYLPGKVINFGIKESSNEIGQIVSSFKKMQENIDYYNTQLTHINERLEHKVDEKTAELKHNYYYDGMTKLPKRVKLSEDLEQEELSLAILNLDAFKEVNDFYGYAAGDELLRRVGMWILSSGYRVYRLSGDEFAIAFDSNIKADELLLRVEKLLIDLHNTVFFYNEEPIHVSATCGVCESQPDILNKADMALHHAKESRRRACIYSKELNIEEKYRRNMEISSLIKDALKNDRVVVYYQPIVEISSMQITKYEALIRIIDKNGTVLAPSEFLQVAQKGRFYAELTRRVSELICKEFKHRKESVTFNISASDILNPATTSAILKNIRDANIGDRIVFEILESEGVENIAEVSDFISEVKKMGAKIAVDDFGTGYSNFENILKLNIDFLKIDGSLIRQINENKNARAIVETIVSFAKKLNIAVVAEFVCSADIFEAVKEIGVENAQGYYLGKPSLMREVEHAHLSAR
ncbi:MAG TPA: bifunctional diguanylate cyclase/phosphodiesterase [Campylobacterales bacterium]|nr:bifunctional diguanylate cyclase/phosphodiesterase [Campylobacterales bacterium]